MWHEEKKIEYEKRKGGLHSSKINIGDSLWQRYCPARRNLFEHPKFQVSKHFPLSFYAERGVVASNEFPRIGSSSLYGCATEPPKMSSK